MMTENPSTKGDNDVDAAITAVVALRKSRENLMCVFVYLPGSSSVVLLVCFYS